MALGNSRPRNWGKDFQAIALADVLKRRRVAYKVVTATLPSGRVHRSLWLTPSHNGVTLPFYLGSCATLNNLRRGRWEAVSALDGHVLATGISERDVVRATIQKVWN